MLTWDFEVKWIGMEISERTYTKNTYGADKSTYSADDMTKNYAILHLLDSQRTGLKNFPIF